MKHSFFSCRNQLVAVCALAAALLTAPAAHAGLNVPYSPDANTLHLWHLDDPLLTNGVTNILAMDAVTGANAITLTNLGDPNPGVPPYTDTSLGNLSIPGLGNCMSSSDRYGFCYDGPFSDVSQFCDTNTGAFTFEALVNFTDNPLALPNNMEVVCGDTGGGIANRGWQFRINNAGKMEFNLLGGSGSDNDWLASLPTTGPDAAVAGQWYHMACTCTGNNPTNGDTPYILTFYWTLLDHNRTAADPLATFTMTRALNGTTSSGSGTVEPNIGIGGSGRRITTGGNGVANGEGLIGSVDEVRISNIARGSNQMAFYPGLAVPYSPDAATLHLWHFDDLALTNGVTNILAADAVLTASITLTNLGDPNPGVPPYTDTSLGNPSFRGLGNCMSSSDRYGFCYDGPFADVSQFCDTNTGAFTFEALVNFTDNPLALPNNMEVVCGDTGGGIANRGWQFRINTSGQMEFNDLGGSGSDNDWKAALPATGPDATVAGQWYHMACTCTGNNPTNGDTPYILTFYWTLLDPNRSAADPLATFTMTRALNGTTSSGAGTVEPNIGIGGSGRRITTGGNGVANGEGLLGSVDEVRVSSIARASNQMAFHVGGALNPPAFTVQPASNTLIGYGQTLTLSPLVSGTAPLSFQWQQTNSVSGGWSSLATQTNAALVIPNVTFGASGSYRLVVNNAAGIKTSIVVKVVVGAAFSELYDTGVGTNGVLDQVNLPGNPDPHYILHDSADVNYLGPEALVWNMSTYPIANQGGNFSNPDDSSAWIGPESSSSGYSSPDGKYVYRTTFLLDSVDTTRPAALSGLVYANVSDTDILINGQSTGNVNTAANSSGGKFSAPFVITNGFVPGLNTLDFVTDVSTNGQTAWEESALRVEMSGIGQALPAGLPTILVQPTPSQTVRDAATVGTSEATFSVIAVGRPPLSYQWYTNGASGVPVPLTVPGATSRTLTYSAAIGDAPTVGGQGTNFTVVVSDPSGSVTSAVAVLTVVGINLPPIAPNYTYYIYSNQTLNVDLSMLLNNASDPSGDTLTLSAYDTVTTNESATSTGNLGPTGDVLSYTPNPGFLGADKFTYSVSDSLGDTTVGTVYIHVLPVHVPAVAAPSQAAGNLVVSGSGGAPNGAYTILGSTSLLTPASTWTAVATGTFDGSGNFSVSLPINTNTAGSFYVLQVP